MTQRQQTKLDKLCDEFIASMQWSDTIAADLKSLVIGNVRGFCSFLQIRYEADAKTLLRDKNPIHTKPIKTNAIAGERSNRGVK